MQFIKCDNIVELLAPDRSRAHTPVSWVEMV